MACKLTSIIIAWSGELHFYPGRIAFLFGHICISLQLARSCQGPLALLLLDSVSPAFSWPNAASKASISDSRPYSSSGISRRSGVSSSPSGNSSMRHCVSHSVRQRRRSLSTPAAVLRERERCSARGFGNGHETARQDGGGALSAAVQPSGRYEIPSGSISTNPSFS
jgi:hypothetical protein